MIKDVPVIFRKSIGYEILVNYEITGHSLNGDLSAGNFLTLCYEHRKLYIRKKKTFCINDVQYEVIVVGYSIFLNGLRNLTDPELRGYVMTKRDSSAAITAADEFQIYRVDGLPLSDDEFLEVLLVLGRKLREVHIINNQAYFIINLYFNIEQIFSNIMIKKRKAIRQFLKDPSRGFVLVDTEEEEVTLWSEGDYNQRKLLGIISDSSVDANWLNLVYKEEYIPIINSLGIKREKLRIR